MYVEPRVQLKPVLNGLLNEFLLTTQVLNGMLSLNVTLFEILCEFQTAALRVVEWLLMEVLMIVLMVVQMHLKVLVALMEILLEVGVHCLESHLW